MGRAGPKAAHCSQKHAQNKNSLQNGPRVLFIGGQVTGLCSNVGSASNALVICGRTWGIRLNANNCQGQLGFRETRADWAYVRPLILACDCECVRTHQVRSNALGRNPLLHFQSTLPFANHDLIH